MQIGPVVCYICSFCSAQFVKIASLGHVILRSLQTLQLQLLQTGLNGRHFVAKSKLSKAKKCKKSILKTFVNQGPSNEAWWCIGNSWRLIFKGMHSLASSRISNTYGHVQVHMGHNMHNGQGDMPNTGKPYGGCTKGHTFPAISRSTEFFNETFLK